MAYITNQTTINQGKIINLSNSIEQKFIDTQILGDTYQASTPTPSSPVPIQNVTGLQNVTVCGKNLFDGVVAQGEFSSRGNINATTIRNYSVNYIPVKPNTNYVSNYNINRMCFYDANKTFLNRSSNYNFKTFTIPSNAYYIRFDISTDYDTNTMQIEYGSTSTTYEAYQGQSYDINLGKNLFDNTKITSVTNGTYFDEIVTSNTMNTSPFNLSIYNNLTLNAGTYYISADIKLVSGTTTFGKINDGIADGITISYPTLSNEFQRYVVSKTYNTLTNIQRILVQFTNSTNAVIEIKNIMVSKSNNTSYSPYFTPIELNKIEDYQDYISGTPNNWVINRQIGKIVFDGTQGFGDNGVAGDIHEFVYSGSTDKMYGETNILSNYFGTSTSNAERIRGRSNNSNLYFRINRTTADTTTEFKNWLSTHNTTVIYPLATLTTETITNTELINQLNALYNANSYNGTTNIIVSGDLAGYLKVETYTQNNPYSEVIYSQDDKNKAKIWFNNVEMQDVGIKCEKITKTSRILPSDGNKVLTLSNYVATELEIILHNVDLTLIQDQVKVSIGTLIESSSLGDTYQWIPLGIFNIQNEPVINDNKLTLKLRDNRVKFDFKYDAKPLIDTSGGQATKRQILDNICSIAGMEHEIDNFPFEDDELAIYDNSINATNYISFLAEQGGKIPTTNRNGKLIFVDLTDLYTWRIPKSILPSPYTLGTPYTIQRVVYESGIIKYESAYRLTEDTAIVVDKAYYTLNNHIYTLVETPVLADISTYYEKIQDESLDTLYLNSQNPYITRQEQVDYIYDILKGFTIDSVTTQKMLGNPAIDPYDLIEVYDDRDINEPTIFKTFANQIYTFNGKHGQSFDTQIGKDQRTENVSLKGESSFQRWARTQINNLDATVQIQTGKITSDEEEIAKIKNNYVTIDTIESIETSINQIQTDTYTKTQIQEIANGTGVDGVKVTAVVSTEATFDKDGMHYSKTDAPTSSTINYKGLEVDDNRGNEILYAGYDDDPNSLTYGNSIVRTDNITVDTYLQCADRKGRIEKYTDENNNTGVGFFLT